MKLDEELDRLYGSSLADFTQVRNELARELRSSGDREAADDVKALAKPSISAWAVNQLVRAQRMQIRSLVTASDRVRDQQEELLRGGSPDALQEAVARQREVVGALLESSKSVLASAGHPATEATLDRIRKTLLAVGGDDEGRRLLEAGRLTEDLDPAGFGAPVPGAAPATGAQRPPGKRRPARRTRPAAGRAEREKARRIEAAEAKLSALEVEAAELKERVKAAKDEVRNAERSAQAARRAAEDEQRRLDRLTARLEAARAGVERARSS
jgi:hypothetical protein